MRSVPSPHSETRQPPSDIQHTGIQRSATCPVSRATAGRPRPRPLFPPSPCRVHSPMPPAAHRYWYTHVSSPSNGPQTSSSPPPCCINAPAASAPSNPLPPHLHPSDPPLPQQHYHPPPTTTSSRTTTPYTECRRWSWTTRRQGRVRRTVSVRVVWSWRAGAHARATHGERKWPDAQHPTAPISVPSSASTTPYTVPSVNPHPALHHTISPT
jgi:hypothetical protein